MPIDSFGYQVLSLREVIEALQRAAAETPSTLDLPVWVANIPPLHWPVRSIANDMRDGAVAIYVEKGGN